MCRPEPHWPPLVQGSYESVTGLQELAPDERQVVLEALLQSNAPSSQDTICVKFRKFWKYCSSLEPPLSPLPVSEARMCHYISFLLTEGSVNPKYFPQYISAVSSVGRWLGMAASYSGSVHVQRTLRAALLTTVEQRAVNDIQVLPSSTLLTLIRFGLDTSNVSELRAVVITTFNFIFMSRGSSSTYITLSDLVLGTNCITFTETFYKGKRALRHVNRVRTFFTSSVPTVRDIFSRWFHVRTLAWSDSRQGDPGFLWALPIDGAYHSRLLPHWFAMVSQTWPELFPVSQSLTLHSLRRSGATAAYGAHASMERIWAWGGWSMGSSSISAYVDFLRPPDAADVLFFGWMLSPPGPFVESKERSVDTYDKG